MAGKHGGGAWKVAYADFVTAMMALFLTLWITAQDQKIKESVQRAFTNPFMSVTKEHTGVMPEKANTPAQEAGQGKFDAPSPMQMEMLRKINEELVRLLESNPDFDDSSVKLEFTPEGLNISVLDRTRKPVFEPDSAALTAYGDWVFSTLAWVISRHQTFLLHLGGHTESGHSPARPEYGNWELTADRANAARRILVKHGVQGEQVRRVSGFADTKPIDNVPPTDETNRRVTVLVRVEGTVRS